MNIYQLLEVSCLGLHFFKNIFFSTLILYLSPAQIFRFNVFTNFCLTLGFLLVNILSFHLNETINITEVKFAQECSILCNLMDYTVHWILQARILEWVAFPFSRRSSQPRDQSQISCIAGRFFTSWATREAQEYWSGCPIPSPADLPNPVIKPGSPALQAD